MVFFKRLRSTAGGRRIWLAGIVVTGMLGLLLLQLGWWLVFFEIRYDEYEAARQENDFLRAAIANGERPEALPDGGDLMRGLARDHNERYVAAPAAVEERRQAHLDRRIMLISETAFLLLVLVYGHYRIIRALGREWRLVRDRNNLIQSVTHELKTPLAGALLHLQTLAKRELEPEKRREILEEGIGDLRRLEEQLNNLLTGSALLRGRDRQPVGKASVSDAAEQIRGCVARLAPLARARSVQVTVEAPEQLNVRLDPHLLDKVISNLLQNAIQYSPEGGRVAARLERQPVRRKFCILTVRDEGPGIAAGERENVFQPLYRLEEHADKTDGSGMGLYIVREILNAAGGSVRILPPGESGGLVIEARLPRARLMQTK